jgi:hypothetical protein
VIYPQLEPQLKVQFLPQVISAFAAQTNFRLVQKKLPEYSYRAGLGHEKLALTAALMTGKKADEQIADLAVDLLKRLREPGLGIRR